MANVKIPYALIPAVKVEQRRAHMVSAIARGLPVLDRVPIDDSKTLYVACYGPSLRKTFEDLRDKHPLIAMSGATKFLAEQGIIADYALEMDPRQSQLVVSLPPVPGVTYLIASCVVPEYFDRVLEAGNKVLLWHTVSATYEDELKWVAANHGNHLVVHGGSTVGLTSIHIGGILGYRRFVIHGMDGSFSDDGDRHAAFHGGKTQHPKVQWAALNKTYKTSQIMSNAVAETVNLAKNFPIITIWHGDGLTQALMRKYDFVNAACADQTEKVARLMGQRVQILNTPPIPMTPGASFWDALLPFLKDGDLPELVEHIAICEPRRAIARYNTGTVPFESAVYLRALSRFFEPTVVAEVGTFIGTSALALKPKRVLYTCDRSNDCVPMTDAIISHPYQGSTQMLKEIHEKVDLFFFDGRIQPEDLPEIQRVSHEGTVYVVDDYMGREKGVVNVDALRAIAPQHTLIPPAPGPSTLAVLVPFQKAPRA